MPTIPSLSADTLRMRTAIDAQLDAYTQAADGCPQRLTDAIRYSVLSGGKRFRPLLVLMACEAVGGDWLVALPTACAVEFVHVYSLVHDDLPAMDNDELRRGVPTCHRQFDEATAILVGDCLPMLAIEVICKDMPREKVAECCGILASAAGRCWLVGGQTDDLAAEGRFGPATEKGVEQLKRIHRRKTGALIETSLRLGGIAGDANPTQLRALSDYGWAIGLAFQIIDDCLDVESTSEQLGKKTRKDSKLGKMTYPGLLGISGSRKLAEQYVREALEAIAVLGEAGNKLADLARFVVERKS